VIRAVGFDHHASSRRASVIIEEPAEPLMSVNPMAAIDRRRAIDEFVAEALVIPFPVVMCDELRDRPPEMTVAK